MVEVELKYGKDPTMHKMAENVIKAQKSELVTMHWWLVENDRKNRDLRRLAVL